MDYFWLANQDRPLAANASVGLIIADGWSKNGAPLRKVPHL